MINDGTCCERLVRLFKNPGEFIEKGADSQEKSSVRQAAIILC